MTFRSKASRPGLSRQPAADWALRMSFLSETFAFELAGGRLILQRKPSPLSRARTAAGKASRADESNCGSGATSERS